MSVKVKDEELVAIHEILNILEPLSLPKRQRVISYLIHRSEGWPESAHLRAVGGGKDEGKETSRAPETPAELPPPTLGL